jgi:hypothetical protein
VKPKNIATFAACAFFAVMIMYVSKGRSDRIDSDRDEMLENARREGRTLGYVEGYAAGSQATWELMRQRLKVKFNIDVGPLKPTTTPSDGGTNGRDRRDEAPKARSQGVLG